MRSDAREKDDINCFVERKFCAYQGTVGLIYLECDKFCPAGNSSERRNIIFFPVALRPSEGHGFLSLEVSRSHTTTHQSR